MPVPRIALPLISEEPLHVSVTRGGAEESCHAVDIALCDGDGAVLVGLGDVERWVFPRSAMKPLQAIALAEAWQGMAADLRLTPAEFSLVCGSHNGQPEHVEAVQGLLAKFGLNADLLTCGRQWSGDRLTMVDQARSLDHPDRIHNNCSGKHAGMLALSTVIGAGPQGYAAMTHPVQQKILGVLEAMVGLDLMAFPQGIDGCGAPALSAPLGNWARGFALFAGGGELPAGRSAACARVRGGIAAAPRLIAGDRRLCTALAAGFGERITAKIGAEGVYGCGFHEFGLGAMVKARDGNARAAEAAIAALIHALGYDLPDEVSGLAFPRLRNWAGDEVGEITVGSPLMVRD
ncbi:MAG: asparaginase [Candidatus Puniceispirillaceae bacterium]